MNEQNGRLQSVCWLMG